MVGMDGLLTIMIVRVHKYPHECASACTQTHTHVAMVEHENVRVCECVREGGWGVLSKPPGGLKTESHSQFHFSEALMND